MCSPIRRVEACARVRPGALFFRWRSPPYLVAELPLLKLILLAPTTAPVIASTRMHAFAFRDHPDGTGLASMPGMRPVDSMSVSSEGSTAPYMAILTLCEASYGLLRSRGAWCLSRKPSQRRTFATARRSPGTRRRPGTPKHPPSQK